MSLWIRNLRNMNMMKEFGYTEVNEDMANDNKYISCVFELMDTNSVWYQQDTFCEPADMEKTDVNVNMDKADDFGRMILEG